MGLSRVHAQAVAALFLALGACVMQVSTSVGGRGRGEQTLAFWAGEMVQGGLRGECRLCSAEHSPKSSLHLTSHTTCHTGHAGAVLYGVCVSIPAPPFNTPSPLRPRCRSRPTPTPCHPRIPLPSVRRRGALHKAVQRPRPLLQGQSMTWRRLCCKVREKGRGGVACPWQLHQKPPFKLRPGL